MFGLIQEMGLVAMAMESEEGKADLRATVRDFITQAEACNFTDRHGYSLEMNTAYRALKASVSE